MKQIFIFSIFSLFITLGSYAQSDDDWDTKTYNIGDFTEIYLQGGGYKVFLSQGDECALRIKVNDEDVFDYLKVKNEHDELSLRIEKKYIDYNRISLYITVKNLEKIDLEGGMNLKTKGYLDLDNFSLHVQGGAKLELDVKAEDIRIFGEGGVLIEMDGVAQSLDVKLSGAGHVDADELKTEDVKFKIEGVGTGSVYATKTLYAKIEGVGKIKYRGNPRVTKNIEGLGSVKRQ